MDLFPLRANIPFGVSHLNHPGEAWDEKHVERRIGIMSWTEEDDALLIDCIEDGELDKGEIAELFDGKTRIDVMERVSQLKRDGRLEATSSPA